MMNFLISCTYTYKVYCEHFHQWLQQFLYVQTILLFY